MENKIDREFLHENTTAVHLIHSQEASNWEVRIYEDKLSYMDDQYESFDLAYAKAKIIEHSCRQDISIFIIADNETQIQITKEKLTDEAALLLFLKSIHTLYIYFNHKTGDWEIFTFTRHNVQSITKISPSKEEAVAVAEEMKNTNPDIQIIMEDELNVPLTFDNTCRARKCKWSLNDACILLPRDTSLPLPQLDLNQMTWTEVNSMVPRTCQRYEETA